MSVVLWKDVRWKREGRKSCLELLLGSLSHLWDSLYEAQCTEDLCCHTLLHTTPCFSFELGQVGDLLALLELMVEVPAKGDFRASAIRGQAVDFFVWLCASGAGGWVLQNICSCSPSRYVCLESLWVQLCCPENKSCMGASKNLQRRPPLLC